ncbi:MAG: hypothetical protein HC802_02820 [Caldilineaceae bacterium]|nr:hypothetical protein [Caldilineaceae bacterium]
MLASSRIRDGMTWAREGASEMEGWGMADRLDSVEAAAHEKIESRQFYQMGYIHAKGDGPKV